MTCWFRSLSQVHVVYKYHNIPNLSKAVFVLGENHFRKCFSGNEAVWLVRKILFSGNWNPLTQKKSLWPRKCFYTSIFSSKHFRKMRERERERERARAQEEKIQSEIASSSSSPRSRSTARSREGEIAIFARSRRRDIAVDRDLAKKVRSRSRRRSRSRHGRRTGNIFVVDDFFFLGCGLCFLICVFLLLFQTPENIFRKIFWNATKHMETFSFSGN